MLTYSHICSAFYFALPRPRKKFLIFRGTHKERHSIPMASTLRADKPFTLREGKNRYILGYYICKRHVKTTFFLKNLLSFQGKSGESVHGSHRRLFFNSLPI